MGDSTFALQEAQRLIWIGLHQRQIIIVYLVLILGLALAVFAQTQFQDPQVGSAINTAWGLLWLVAMVVRLVFTYRLASSLGSAVGTAAFLTLISLVDLIGLVVMLYLSTRATSVLKQAGVRVGLGGARQEDLDRLWERSAVRAQNA